MTDDYAVFGHPIAHSLSPRIHALFAQQLAQAMRYRAEDVLPSRFEACVDQFFADGGRGLNITLPLKGLAFDMLRCRHAAGLTAFARRAGAVNTLWLDERGALCGDNTDGLGLIRDLRDNLAWPIGPAALLIGAGGAARAALAALRCLTGAAPPAVVVANRHPERAQRMLAELLAAGLAAAGDDAEPPLSACGLSALASRMPRDFDLVLNATSAGLSNAAPELPDAVLAGAGACYDLQYGPAAVPFLEQAGRCARPGTPCSDGLGMLVEQAADSFARWRGLRPDTAAVLRSLRGG